MKKDVYADIRERDRDIYLKWKEGQTYEQLSLLFLITRQRAYEICHAQERRVKHRGEANPLLTLSGRSYNALHRYGIKTAEELKNIYLSGELNKIRGIGKSSVLEIENFLSKEE